MRLLRCTFALVLGVQLGAALIKMQAGLLSPAAVQPQAPSPLTDPISRGFEYACQQGDTTGCVEAATRMIMQDTRSRARGESRLKQHCQQGAGLACHALARLYDGRMTGEAAQDAARALLYTIEGCERGHADACHDAGLAHLFGGLISPHPERAAGLLARGCALGSPMACMSELLALEEARRLGEAVLAREGARPKPDASIIRSSLARTVHTLDTVGLYRASRDNTQRACRLGLEAACNAASDEALDLAKSLLCDQGHDAACQRIMRRDPFQPPAVLPNEE
jgi:TPR repeat protein